MANPYHDKKTGRFVSKSVFLRQKKTKKRVRKTVDRFVDKKSGRFIAERNAKRRKDKSSFKKVRVDVRRKDIKLREKIGLRSEKELKSFMKTVRRLLDPNDNLLDKLKEAETRKELGMEGLEDSEVNYAEKRSGLIARIRRFRRSKGSGASARLLDKIEKNRRLKGFKESVLS